MKKNPGVTKCRASFASPITFCYKLKYLYSGKTKLQEDPGKKKWRVLATSFEVLIMAN